jgi:hypothetical protein
VPLPVDKGRHVIVVTATATERCERIEEWRERCAEARAIRGGVDGRAL